MEKLVEEQRKKVGWWESERVFLVAQCASPSFQANDLEAAGRPKSEVRAEVKVSAYLSFRSWLILVQTLSPSISFSRFFRNFCVAAMHYTGPRACQFQRREVC